MLPGRNFDKNGVANFATFPWHCVTRNDNRGSARLIGEKLMPVDFLQRQEAAGRPKDATVKACSDRRSGVPGGGGNYNP
jgi:hypothetical protein